MVEQLKQDDILEVEEILEQFERERNKKVLIVDELVDKNENEIKQFLKEVILEKTKYFDWNDFSLKYNKIFADYDKEKNIGDNSKSILGEIGTIIDTSDCGSSYERNSGMSLSYYNSMMLNYNFSKCSSFIFEVFVENGKIILEYGSNLLEYSSNYVRIKNKEQQSLFINFLTISIMAVCERLNDEDDYLNSIFE